MATNGITLAPISRNDLSTLQRFRNSPEVYEHVRERRLLTMEDMEKWWEVLAADRGRTVRMFGVKYDVGGERDDVLDTPYGRQLIGCAGLMSVDWINRRAELSVYTVPSKHEREAVLLVLSHAFRDLGLYRIEAETITHKRADLCKALGFTCEGSRSQSYWRDGKFVDSMHWGLLAGDLS